MVKNGSEILIDALVEQGVDTIFGYPGGAVLNIYDALYKNSDRIHHILTAHEQGAAHAADGYARSTGRVGVCLATSGPGATNLVTGIATAYMDSIPMVAITGNVGTSLIGRDSFQEVYIAGITMPITKHNFVVRHVEELADTVREAFRIAQSGRPGPVLIDIPKDVTGAECEFIPKGKVEVHETYDISEEQLKTVAEMLDKAERPFIYYGGGVELSDAGEALLALMRKAEVPSAHTMMAIGCVPDDDPLSLGMIGMHGTVSADWAVERSDLLLCIGARFSDRVATNTGHFAPGARIIHVDIDAAEINKNIETTCSVVSDAKTFLEKVLPYVKENKHTAWLEQIAEWRQKLDYRAKDDESVIPSAPAAPHGHGRDPGGHHHRDRCRSASAVERPVQRPQTSASVPDLGRPRHHGLRLRRGGRRQIAFPGRTVVHITGDGSFHMNLNEICTAVSYKLPIITVIMNNRVLGNVRQWQTMFYGGRYSQTDPHRKTDYVKLADAFGAVGYRATNIAELREALRKAQQSEDPVLIDCQIDKDERVLPMIPAGGTIDDLVTD